MTVRVVELNDWLMQAVSRKIVVTATVYPSQSVAEQRDSRCGRHKTLMMRGDAGQSSPLAYHVMPLARECLIALSIARLPYVKIS